MVLKEYTIGGNGKTRQTEQYLKADLCNIEITKLNTIFRVIKHLKLIVFEKITGLQGLFKNNNYIS